MIAAKINGPSLDILTPGQYGLIIHAIYENICHVPLCWLAEEELETIYPDGKINDDLCFIKNRGSLEFRLTANNEVVAKIYFDGEFDSGLFINR